MRVYQFRHVGLPRYANEFSPPCQCAILSFMKLFLLGGIVLLAGCQWQTISSVTNTEPEIFWVNYYPTQCNDAPWGDTLEETAIIEYYATTVGVTVHSLEVTPPAVDFFTCSACGCPTGVEISVQTDAVGKATLLEHGFVEEELTTIEPVVEEELITEVSETEVTEVDLSAEDQVLQARVQLVQSALQDYYSQYGSYPDALTDLTVQLDATGMTYTPIGVTPADYYDLSVEYSTGREVVNP